MSSFTAPLNVTPAGLGQRWRLLTPFSYYIDAQRRDVVVVPHGFVTDFASVPRPLWSLLPPWGRYGKAAVVHDYLCVMRDRPSAEVHRIFREAMAVLGVPWWKRWLMWAAVRCCGPRFDGPPE